MTPHCGPQEAFRSFVKKYGAGSTLGCFSWGPGGPGCTCLLLGPLLSSEVTAM
jgi:hypothetical protein